MDTIHLVVAREQAGNIDACLNSLTNLRHTTHQDTAATYLTGNARNMIVNTSDRRIAIKGSLNKFCNGHNLYNLTLQDCKEALEQLADFLHLPIAKATVTKLEIGFNIHTALEPELYYPYFGQCQRLERLTQPKSLRYESGQRLIRVYDKQAESRKSRTPIPDELIGMHLLRFELSFSKNLNKQLNHSCITPEVLTEPYFYSSLIEKWYKAYQNIQKIGIPTFGSGNAKLSASGFMKHAEALATSIVGQEALLHIAKELNAQDRFTNSKAFQRAKESIKKLNSSAYTETCELVQELDEKMLHIYQNYR